MVWRTSCFLSGMQMSDVLTRYLDLTADQMKLTAGNLANVDTPGYKAQGIDFEAEFSRALTGEDSSPSVSEVEGLVARPDGNTVSLDRESMQMAKTQMEFRMGVELLKHSFSATMEAIHVDGK